MCFHLAFPYARDQLETRFEAVFMEPDLYKPSYYVPAHDNPPCPVITDSDPEHISFLEWGLIPFWVKDPEKAGQVRQGTYNARDDTIFEKPSFRTSIMKKRCLVIAGGFYEWREVDGTNYPYHIRMKDKEPFSIAGIWDSWSGPDSVHDTFSVITTRANPLLEMVHNKKKRMPAILMREDEKQWLAPYLMKDDILDLLHPIPDDPLEAFTISRLITTKGVERNVPEVLAPYDYHELKYEQSKLF